MTKIHNVSYDTSYKKTVREGKAIHYGDMCYDEIVVLLKADLLESGFCRFPDTETKDYVEKIQKNNEKVDVKIRIDYESVHCGEIFKPILFLNDVSVFFYIYGDSGWFNNIFYTFFDIIQNERKNVPALKP